MLYETILCATDGFEHSDRALAHAGALAAATGADLHVVQVTESSVTDGMFGGEHIAFAPAERRARVEAQIAEITCEGRVCTIPHFLPAGRGSVADRIVRLAEKIDADVIVVGSRGGGLVSGALNGSVSKLLPHLTLRPIVVVSRERRHAKLRVHHQPRMAVASANGGSRDDE